MVATIRTPAGTAVGIGFQAPCPAMTARAKGGAALIFATLPDGFDRATELMNDLISEELAAHTLLVLGMRTARGEKI